MEILLSLLLTSVAGMFLQYLCFTEYIIKRMRYTARLVLFLVTFLIIGAVFERYYRVMGKRYDGLLGQYKKAQAEREEKSKKIRQ